MSNETPQKAILLIAAHPKGTPSLRLQEEERKIKERLRVAGYGKVPLYSAVAARPMDVQQAMLDFEPQIVHFSGHGTGQAGLALEDEAGNTKLVSSEALANLFRLFEKVECVVFNACYSEAQARVVAQHIPFVIGMSQEIGDTAAIVFSVSFYTALGAGKDYKFAYEFGCNAIQLAGISESLTPVLIQNNSLSESVQLSNPQNSILSEKVVPAQNISSRSPTDQSTSDPYYWVLDPDFSQT
jgi:CHAT domain